MQVLIDHPTVRATRAEVVLSDEGRVCILHVDTKLVLTPGAPYYSERAVTDLVELANAYRQRHAICRVFLHECD